MTMVRLRPVQDSDLDAFFAHQQDEAAAHQAAFTAPDPSDRGAFDAHWARIRGDDRIAIRTVLVGEAVAGHVVRFPQDGELEISYWIDRAHWGRGVATRALAALLEELPERPVRARVVEDNAASRRVLEKCAFVVVGRDRGFANARGTEVEELVLRLD